MKWIAALAVVASGCVLGKTGNGDVVSQSRALTGFTRIDARGSMNVKMSQGSTFSVTVVTDSNLQAQVDATVEGDALILDDHQVFESTQMEVDVQMPALAGVSLEGSGNVDVAGADENTEVDLVLTGSGNMTFAGSAPTMVVSLGGSGNFVATGSAGSFNASLAGSGNLDASKWVAQTAQLNLTGSGDLDAQVQQTVSLNVSGSGQIRWSGPATVVSTSDTGSGGISHL